MPRDLFADLQPDDQPRDLLADLAPERPQQSQPRDLLAGTTNNQPSPSLPASFGPTPQRRPGPVPIPEPRVFEDPAVPTRSAPLLSTQQATLNALGALATTPETVRRTLENPVTQPLADVLEPVTQGFDVGGVHVPGTQDSAGFFDAARDRLSEGFPGTTQRIQDFNEEANQAFAEAGGGDFSRLGSIITDPEKMGTYIGNALPTFALAAASRGNAAMIAALETAEVTKNAEDFEQRTGMKVSPGEFNTAVSLVALVNTTLERTGLNAVLKGRQGRTLFGKWLRTLAGGGMEAGTEAAQETTTNVATRLFDPEQPVGEGVGAATLGGGGVGTTVSGARQFSGQAQQPRDLLADVDEQPGGAGQSQGNEQDLSDAIGQTRADRPAPPVAPEVKPDVKPETIQTITPDAVAPVAAQLTAESLGVPRDQLPQIRVGQQDEFVAELERDGVTVQRTEVPASQLRPTQGEMNPEKVASFANTLRQGGTIGRKQGGTPTIVSSDGFILDGHHRLAGQRVVDPSQTLPALRVDLPIQQLLDRARAFGGAQVEGVDTNQAPAGTANQQRAQGDFTARVKPSSPGILGSQTTVFTPDAKPVDVQYGLVEVDDLIPSHDAYGNVRGEFPAELQPRQRNRKSSQAQIQGMARNLIPELIMASPTTDTGAPVTQRRRFFSDGKEREKSVVESGNARVAAMQLALQQGNYDHIKEAVIANAAEFGLDPNVARQMKAPAIERRRLTQMDDRQQQEFARASNQSTASRMAPAEQAAADAEQLTDDDLALFAPDESGNVLARSNDSFVNRFMQAVGGTERSALVDPQGRPNREVVSRIQAAMFYKAYRSDNLVQLAAEDADPDIKNILAGLQKAAPAFARARAINVSETEKISTPLIDAIDLFRASKRTGQNIDEFLNQQGMFGDAASAEAARIASFIAANTRSARKMGEAFTVMGQVVESELLRAQNISLFEGLDIAPQEIIDHAITQATDQTDSQADVFGAQKLPGEESAGRRGGESQPGQQDGRTGPGSAGQVSELTADFTVDVREPSEVRQPEGGATAAAAGDVLTAGPIQIDLFTPGTHSDQVGAPAPKVKPLVTNYRIGSFSIGVDRIQSPNDAAHVIAHIRKGAQENFVTIVTDEDGRPLEIQRGSLGVIDGANVQVYTVIGAAKNVPGAAQIWFAHNHPSGAVNQSTADLKITAALTDVARTVGLSPRGMIVVSPGNRRFTHYTHSLDSAGQAPDGKTEQPITTAARRRGQVPVTERQLRAIPSPGPALTSPEIAERSAKEHLNEGETGFMLLDQRHREVAFVPVPQGTKATEAAADLITAAESVNAAAALGVFKHIETLEIRHLKDAVSRSGLRLLDVITEQPPGDAPPSGGDSNLQTLHSAASYGLMEESANYRAEVSESDKVDRPQARQPVADFAGLFRRAEASQQVFKDEVDSLADTLGGRAEYPPDGPVKARVRARDKVKDDYDGDIRKLKDVLRATIVLDSPSEVNDAYARLGQYIQLTDDSGNRNWWGDDSVVPVSGYRDAKVTFVTEDGLIAELQLNTPAMFDAKNQAHELYQRARNIEGNNKQPNGKVPAEALARMEALSAQQREVHEEAVRQSYAVDRSASTSRSNTSRDTGAPFQSADAELKTRAGSVSNAQASPRDTSTTGTPSTDKSRADSGRESIDKGISDTSTQNIAQSVPKDQRGFVSSRPLNDIQVAQERRFNPIAAFVRRQASKVGLAQDVPDAYRLMLRRFRAETQEGTRKAEDVAKFREVLSAEHRKLISDVIEGELKLGVIPPEHVQVIAAQMQEAVETQTDELIRLGFLSRETADRWRGKYLSRFYRKPKDPIPKALRRQFMKIDGHYLKGRGMFEMVQKSEVEKYKRLGWEVRNPQEDTQQVIDGLRDTDKVLMWRDYTPAERAEMGEIRDAVYRFARGYMETARDIAMGRLFKNLAESDMASPNQRHERQVQVPDTTIPGTGGVKRYGALAGMWVDRDIWDDLEHVRDPTPGDPVTRAYMRGLSFWKEGKVAMNPVVHSNNIWSSWIMTDLYGVTAWNVKAYREAYKEYTGQGPLYQEARKHGLFGTEFYGQEIQQTIEPFIRDMQDTEQAAATKLNKMVDYLARFSGARAYRRAMGRLYRAEDQFFKMVIYKDMREKGASIDDAIDEAERWIFNYADIPRTIRRIKNSPLGLPFLSYTYKAAPALVYAAFTRPWAFAKWFALFAGGNWIAFNVLFGPDHEEEEEREREVMPDFMKGMTSFFTDKAIRWPFDRREGVASYLDLSRRFPLGDLFDMNNQVGGVGIPQPLMPNNPVFTTALMLFANKDSFTGRDVVNKADDLERAWRKRMDWLLFQALPNSPVIPFSYSFDKVMNGVANELGQPVKLIPNVKEYTGLNYYGEEQTLARAFGSTTFGFKVREFDIERQAARQTRKKLGLIRDLQYQIRTTARDQSLSESVKQRQLDDLREQLRQMAADR